MNMLASSRTVRHVMLILLGGLMVVCIQYTMYSYKDAPLSPGIRKQITPVVNKIPPNVPLPSANSSNVKGAGVYRPQLLTNPSVMGDLRQQLLSTRLLDLPQITDPDAPGSLLSQVLQEHFLRNMPANQPNGVSMPILPGNPDTADGTETKVLRWNGTGWRQLHNFCTGNYNFIKTTLKSPAGSAIINIHNLKDDKWVSGALKTKGLWDLPDITTMVNNLRADPELGFIDIGSHVGTFSIVAALLGRKVVAVDPLVANVLRFCKSVQENKFTDKITIFYTAISDEYRKVSFQRDIGNIGGTRIKTAPSGVNTSNVYDPNYIDTVRLDDLVPYIPFKKAFIKMDVEEHEYQVITSGQKFFQQINVNGILMEWMWQKTGRNGQKLRDYLLNLNFLPFLPNRETALDIQNYKIWPNDVLWKKVQQ